jgi:hypothetical protein
VNQKLASFSLPDSLDSKKKVKVKDIARVSKFYSLNVPNPKGCKIVYRPCNVTFNPEVLMASEGLAVGSSEMVTVTATCGDVSLTAKIRIVKKK